MLRASSGPPDQSFVWLGVATNNTEWQKNSLLEIYLEEADWRIASAVPKRSLHVFVAPPATIDLFGGGVVPTETDLFESLNLSDWCGSFFRQNGLMTDLFQRLRDGHDCSIGAAQEKVCQFFDQVAHPVVFAGKNVHYDLMVLARSLPLAFERVQAQKHVYDVGSVCMLYAQQLGIVPKTFLQCRPRKDVEATRRLNERLVTGVRFCV